MLFKQVQTKQTNTQKKSKQIAETEHGFCSVSKVSQHKKIIKRAFDGCLGDKRR